MGGGGGGGVRRAHQPVKGKGSVEPGGGGRLAPPVGWGLGPARGEGGAPMGAGRLASGNPRALCEGGCARASTHAAAPGNPHDRSCADGPARWSLAASVRL